MKASLTLQQHAADLIPDLEAAATAVPDPTWGTMILSACIFVLTYLAIALEKRIRIHKTVSALVGSSLMLILILRPDGSGTDELSAYNRYADFDVIFLLAGMMILVNILRETGVFQYIAIKCAKLGGGHPMRVMVLMLLATAVMSALLDNVTTVLLMAPVILLVAAELRLDPVPFLIAGILASNLGGTATLIGDPPNLLVGAHATRLGFGFDFLGFLIVLAPLVILSMAIFLIVLRYRLHGGMQASTEERARIMDLNEKRAITNPKLLRTGLVVMGLTLAGFIVHGLFHLQPGVVAMAGAGLLLALTRKDAEHALAEIEWTTLFFFLGLFVVVNGAAHAGLLAVLAQGLEGMIGRPEGIAYIAPVLVLWVSGIFGGVMNNVSYTLAALPVVDQLARAFGLEGAAAESMYWAVAMGACFGGNLTPVGAAANLVVLGIAEKNGHPISFARYLKWGVPCAVGSLVLATGYLLLRIAFTG